MKNPFAVPSGALLPLTFIVACNVSSASAVSDGGVRSEPGSGGDASTTPGSQPTTEAGVPPTGGHVTYTLGNDVFRLAATAGATPENVSALVTTAGARQRDRRLNTSPNGAFYVFESGNVDAACNGSNCLVVAPASNPSAASLVREGGNRIEGAEGLSAISNDGTVVVFAATGSSHNRDLYVTRRTGDVWSPAAALTAASTYPWNDVAAIHPDGTKVLFDCGPLPDAGQGSNVCEVGIDGAGFHTVVTSADAPASIATKGALHHADYAPDGSIVFEADWDGERIWRKAGATVTNLSTSAVANDNSPCVLPNGAIVSLWLDRQENPTGAHELKMMNADGTAPAMLLVGNDVADVGIGCGN